MAKDLKHYQRIHTLNEEGKKSFALIGFGEENDSCVTLVRCNEEKLEKELKKWGSFTHSDFLTTNSLKCGEEYRPDNYSIIIRLS